ncbi:unnamed protein product [Calicophoron daubneyi]|uniref:Uncharacterized protein n=1 Tax=Calicophoron daubneyi TaxID=300641 RepID=A0AAV2T0N8_CALDB
MENCDNEPRFMEKVIHFKVSNKSFNESGFLIGRVRAFDLDDYPSECGTLQYTWLRNESSPPVSVDSSSGQITTIKVEEQATTLAGVYTLEIGVHNVGEFNRGIHWVNVTLSISAEELDYCYPEQDKCLNISIHEVNLFDFNPVTMSKPEGDVGPGDVLRFFVLYRMSEGEQFHSDVQFTQADDQLECPILFESLFIESKTEGIKTENVKISPASSNKLNDVKFSVSHQAITGEDQMNNPVIVLVSWPEEVHNTKPTQVGLLGPSRPQPYAVVQIGIDVPAGRKMEESQLSFTFSQKLGSAESSQYRVKITSLSAGINLFGYFNEPGNFLEKRKFISEEVNKVTIQLGNVVNTAVSHYSTRGETNPDRITVKMNVELNKGTDPACFAVLVVATFGKFVESKYVDAKGVHTPPLNGIQSIHVEQTLTATTEKTAMNQNSVAESVVHFRTWSENMEMKIWSKDQDILRVNLSVPSNPCLLVWITVTYPSFFNNFQIIAGNFLLGSSRRLDGYIGESLLKTSVQTQDVTFQLELNSYTDTAYASYVSQTTMTAAADCYEFEYISSTMPTRLIATEVIDRSQPLFRPHEGMEFPFSVSDQSNIDFSRQELPFHLDN